MRQGPNTRRSRGRGSNNNGGGAGGGGGGGARRQSNVPLRHQTFDSNGPDVRIRGNAFQVHEKYQALARDAQASGDRVAAENYLQHAEHYYRIIELINEQAEAANQRNPRQGGRDGNGHAGPNGNGMLDGDDGEEDVAAGEEQSTVGA